MQTKLNLIIPWEEVKEKLKEANTELTDGDLEYDADNAAILIKRLSVKMNRSVEDVKAWIESVAYTKNIAS